MVLAGGVVFFAGLVVAGGVVFFAGLVLVLAVVFVVAGFFGATTLGRLVSGLPSLRQ